jgi:hypothetical protein
MAADAGAGGWSAALRRDHDSRRLRVRPSIPFAERFIATLSLRSTLRFTDVEMPVEER